MFATTCSRKVRVVGYIVVGLIIDLLMNFNSAVKIILSQQFDILQRLPGRHKQSLQFYKKLSSISFGLEVVDVVSWFVFKLVYSAAILRLTFWVRSALAESSNLSDPSDRKKTLHRRLVLFTALPICLSFIFCIPEIWSIAQKISFLNDKSISDLHCAEDFNFVPRDGAMQVTQLAVVVVGLFVYHVGYFALYPDIQDALKFKCK